MGKKGVARTLCTCSRCRLFEPCSGPGKCYSVQMNYGNCFRIFVHVFVFDLLSLLKKIKEAHEISKLSACVCVPIPVFDEDNHEGYAREILCGNVYILKLFMRKIGLHEGQWRTEGGLGVETHPKFRRPSKIVPNSTLL